MPYPRYINTPVKTEPRRDPNDISHWRNSLPPADYQPYEESKHSHSHSNISNLSWRPKSTSSSLVWPVLGITVPIALVSASLLALVFAYRVKSEASLFGGAGSDASSQHGLYILVNYSATRIVFAASLLSTLAPILGSFIMTLWCLPAARMMKDASANNELLHLPTPYQLSLIVGLTLASLERLRAYLAYAFSRSRKAALPPVLNRAATVMIFSLFLATAVFVTDTALHYTTSTIEFDQLSRPNAPNFAFGRGLSPTCLKLNRLENHGLPCSWDYAQAANDLFAYTSEQNEVFRLAQNMSQHSEIRLAPRQSIQDSDLALLIPKSETINANVDYRASTISVSTKCSLISDICHLQRRNTSDAELVTAFNCSNAFYGVLGLDPVSSDFDSQTDLNISALSFKPAKNLEYAFFRDAKLQHLYNPVGYPSTRGETYIFDPHPMPDDELINPLYLGLAGRFSENSEAAGSTLHQQPGFLATQGMFVDFVMSCEIRSYDTAYTWVNGEIQDVSSSSGQNGSVLEIFHGAQLYDGAGAAGYDLQTYLLYAALAPSGAAFEQTWADQYSVKVLSTIGAYTTSRTNLEEQIRTHLLVAKVPKPALGALIACTLSYTVLGVILGRVAYKASSTDTKDLAAQLSLAGLTSAAFDDRSADKLHSSVTLQSGLSGEEISPQSETRRIVVESNPVQGYDFRVWV